MIDLNQVSKTYGKAAEAVTALPPTDLRCERGRLTWIAGPSGSGKSTLLGILGLLVRPTSGQVSIDGRPVSSRSEKETTAIRQDFVGWVPQYPRLFSELSVEKNISLAGRGVRSRHIQGALSAVGLGDLGNRSVNTLSGGQQQRVSIARAAVKSPQALLADEPSSGLDDVNADAVFATLRTFADSGRYVVVASHDHRIASFVDDRIELGG